MKRFKHYINQHFAEDIPVFCNAGGPKDQYKIHKIEIEPAFFSRAGGPPEDIEENLNPRIIPNNVTINHNTLYDPEKDNKGLGEEHNYPIHHVPDYHGTGGVIPNFTNEQAKNARLLSQSTKSNDDYHRIITPYTSNSYKLNQTLFEHHIKGTQHPRILKSNSEEDSDIDTEMMDHLIRTHKLPKEMTVYSGLHTHPNEYRGRIYVHPAYMSTSLSPHVAKDFGKDMYMGHSDGKEYKESRIRNILRLHLPKGQEHLFTDNGSVFPGQGELILPRGTRFQLGQRPTHIIHGNLSSHFGGEKVGHAQYHIYTGRLLPAK